MTIKLFNTLTRTKETFSPINPPKIKMYTCGPTVYDYAHIGNFRTYIFEDLLRRTLELFHHEVEHVMNITDVDDKTIRGATKKDQTLTAYTKPFIEAFFDDVDTLKILRAHHYPAATEYIDPMIEMIQTLLDKGHAYQGTDGSVYYKISSFQKYGALSHLKLNELKAGASERSLSDEYEKDHIADFVLWKGYDAERDGSIYWESPFGKGRPGWHLECSAMAISLLGDSIDIHCGGVDNMFPHHENEIAQSEACTGKCFSKYWLHSEHLLVDGKKMSKSLGNFYTLRSLLEKGFSGVEVRLMLLQTHYKTQLNFTLQGLEGTRSSIDRMNHFISRLMGIAKSNQVDPKDVHMDRLIGEARNKFSHALADDLNISVALSAMYDFIREVNTLCDEGHLGSSQAEGALALMKEFDGVLAIMTFESEVSIPPEVEDLVQQRQDARASKDWGRADEIRDKVQAYGFTIEDTPTGPVVQKNG